MGLNLYRRHRRDCKASHPEEHLSSEFDERKKGWKRCECPIFVSGTLAKKYRRQSTGKWEWEDAKTVIAPLEANGSWTGEVTPKPEPIPEKPAPHRKPIDQAATAFQSEFAEHAALATQKKYRLMLNKLKDFSEQRGFVMIDQWGPSDVREFRSSWNVSPQTAPRRMSMVRAFFEYCHANEWMDRNPARLVKNPRSRDASDRRGEQKLPFSDDEIKRMYEACPKYGTEQRYRWKGHDLADFISLSLYTGLRISDVAQFHIDRMQADTGEILIRTTKAGTHVYTWVPPWLQERIKIRAKEVGPFIFGAHQTKSLEVITDLWRRKLNKLWEMSGPWKVKPTPHRFRHTFARIVLQRGVSVRDVADLLGNSEPMIRKHYAAWIPERQQRLTQILKDAFAEKPKPKLVTMRRKRS
jgi:integrase/recombinase XerD